ncbi:hypothetical protein [Pseudomonas sp. R3-52-08]|uniref:hypothetical protein n=1 Tax=Pseudomonas sp. R3-52-08 TaxID=1173284 RepID=UPI000F6E9DBD|nr:hypothetical protein [Pseudomonas sp. R3-52-08]AZF20864.1 hypothetical protein C4J91_2114 [Pseudomonas sp. R3-52-08]
MPNAIHCVPISQTTAALKRAAVVLDQIMVKERVDDLEEEFFAFWRGDYYYTDIERPESGEVAELSLGKGQRLVFTDDLARVACGMTEADATATDTSA